MTTDQPSLGELPEWDLADLYPGPRSDAVERDLTGAEAAAKSFSETYKGKLAELTGIFKRRRNSKAVLLPPFSSNEKIAPGQSHWAS